MPTVSRQQQKLMKGIATGSIPPGKGKPTKAVAQKFSAADSARGPKKLPTRVNGNSSQSSGFGQSRQPPTNGPGMSSTAAMGSQLPPARKPTSGGMY